MYLNDEGKHPNVDNNLCFSKLPLEVKQCHTKIKCEIDFFTYHIGKEYQF